jgi:hypothetical protein
MPFRAMRNGFFVGRRKKDWPSPSDHDKNLGEFGRETFPGVRSEVDGRLVIGP